VLITDHDDFDLELLASADVPVLDTRNRIHGPNVVTL
jgi:UDP-N-acetyl-D-glucosamine dehydrogenase